jgi:hypothetical protein
VDDADRAGCHRLVADMLIAEVSDDVGHVGRPEGALPVDDRDWSPGGFERLDDSTADKSATTRDKHATSDR